MRVGHAISVTRGSVGMSNGFISDSFVWLIR
jgi:hypothetical protein